VKLGLREHRELVSENTGKWASFRVSVSLVRKLGSVYSQPVAFATGCQGAHEFSCQRSNSATTGPWSLRPTSRCTVTLRAFAASHDVART
jgi:hypothetical protein